MNKIRLGEILEEFTEKLGDGEELEVLTLTERNGFVAQRERFNKRLATEDTSSYKIVRPGDIAFNPYLLWAGAIAQNRDWQAGVISPLYPTFRIREGYDSNYVIRLLLLPDLIQIYDGIAFGSVPRRRRTSVKDFLALEIPAPPPLDEQRRIAAILDHADALRAKRREALARLDELTQSIFIDMFGDPVVNPKRWRMSTLKNAGVSISSGLSVVANGGAEHPENRVIKVSAVSGGYFDPGESKPLPLNYDPPAAHRVREGDLLMTRASGSVSLICITAKVGFAPTNLFLPDKIWRVSLDKSMQLNEVYLTQLFKHQRFRAHVRSAASGASGVRNISQAKVLEFSAAMPPIELQDEFASAATAVARLIDVHRTALTELDALFASLQSRAFRGEL
ncbi:restriction endonuclease subunit S [Nocardia cyriacigeorgica]|uniref:restriction endonuclease subunit S n=1 Tax=Nocardia cyriacigeorgica TaxID=135487 RepID=UPI002458BC61|nr:restriction endonuclease subunit S [Nocardia cyriacigeorgica]